MTRSTNGRTAALAAVTAGLTVAAGLAALSPASAAAGTTQSGPEAPRATASARGGYDARDGATPQGRAGLLRAQARTAGAADAAAIRRVVPGQAVVDVDATTGTPREVARLDGTLTGRSSASPRRVAMGWVRVHRAALGLTRADLGTFRLARDYRDVAGTHHLSWTQHVGGLPVFGNGLQAAVTRNGRLLSVGGSPVSGARVPATRRTTVDSRAAAIGAARRDLGERATPGPDDTAHRVLFVTARGSYVGWQVLTMSAAHPALTVVAADGARVLYRRPLTSDDRSAERPVTLRHSAGLAVRYFPGHVPGGVPRQVDYTARGWLPGNARTLNGNNAHAYSDVNDDDKSQPREEVPPNSPHRWDYRLKPFHLGWASFCDHPYPCSWNPNVPFSWKKNRAQNATQVFFFVNSWHDHLLRSPIGFTEAAGNFQEHNKTHAGKGDDAVDTQTDDGATIDHGLPDGGHVDNANMSTPPDGTPPRMQMYLQHTPGTSYPDGDPFAPTNVGDEADTVYHEYTHGLSNRLVVDASGASTLGDVQAGAMGEAWSDWYAMDYLVRKHLQTDNRRKVDVVLFQYDGAGVALDRTEPLDCAVGSHSPACNGGATGHRGGYTYADYGQVIGLPEVHADGEIWSQTLWDLRNRLGSYKAEALVTRAMELSPANPSFLDERNAILLADTAVFGGRQRAAIWGVFAHRGMGFYAGSLGGDDTTPGADFHVPPANPAAASLSGTVTDRDTGSPVAGVTVTLAFQGGYTPANPSAVTGADGRYRLGPVPAGRYPKLVATAPGYDAQQTAVTVARGGSAKDLQVRRDWAAAGGGGSVTGFTGPDFSPACGPAGAIDGSLATGWGSTTGDDQGDPTATFVPKYVVVRLPRAVDVSSIAVDPSATCGDGGSASTGAYRVETSTNGLTWVPAVAGTFTAADRGRLNELTPTAGAAGVQFVRFWMLGNQTPDFATTCPAGAYSGCSYTDLTELEVYGSPAS